jgi:hypothetical protein
MFKRTLREFGCEKRWTESNAKLIAGKAIDVLGVCVWLCCLGLAMRWPNA